MTTYEKHKMKLKKIENKINSMPPILSPTQLNNLLHHKYTSQGVSVLEPYLQPYWRWCVEQLPLWVAPNLITIVGLIINVLTSILAMIYSPDGTSTVS